MIHQRSWAALFVAVCGLSGCSDEPQFDHLFFRDLSDAPGEASFRPNEIRIQQGVAVRARVTAIDDEGKAMSPLELRTSDPSIFEADLGPKAGQWVFYGVAAGTAELDVYADGRYEGALPVEVLDPAAE